jgi:hypothetical protein
MSFREWLEKQDAKATARIARAEGLHTKLSGGPEAIDRKAAGRERRAQRMSGKLFGGGRRAAKASSQAEALRAQAARVRGTEAGDDGKERR